MLDVTHKEGNNRQILAAYFVALVGFLVVLFPLLYYRENYFFTVHDFLDSWPGWFEVLRRSGLFFSPDSSMPILEGMSSCYTSLDFGVYRWLILCFGPIWGLIVNKIIGIGAGFYTTKRLLTYFASIYYTGRSSESSAHKSLSAEKWIIILLSAAYTVTSIFPPFTVTFAFLPLYFEMLIKTIREDGCFRLKRGCLFLLFGFLIQFAPIGIFAFGVYCLALLIDAIKNRKIKKDLLLYIGFALISIIVSNISIFIYVLRGDQLNRSLLSTSPSWDISYFIRNIVEVGLRGQYHAAPVLHILIPLCVAGYVVLLCQLFKKKDLKQIVFPTIIAGLIILLCAIYVLDEMLILRYIVEKIIPIFGGFNLGRVVYFNNILWYVLTLTIFLRLDRNKVINYCLFLILAVNVFATVMRPGYYRDTYANIFRERSLSDKASFAEFYDTDYFESLKNDIEYDNEGVISVGYHPSVAMYNGFNTLDGYYTVHPLDYHYKFREIVAPALEAYPILAEYYDTWGGRMYCFIDESKNVAPERITKDEAKDLLINTDALYAMGGRYVLSKYKLSNADELGLVLVEHKTDIESSIYRVWVYKVGDVR